MKILRYILILSLFFIPTSSFSQSYAKKLPFSVPKNYYKLPPSALVQTTKGDFEIELFRKTAPTTVKNFEYLARNGFYQGSYFRNYVENKYIQGGSLKNTSKSKPRYLLPPEISEIRHVEGTIGMSAPPRQVNPQRLMDSIEFYIAHARRPRLDGQYTVFGQVIWGLENAKALRDGDKILAIKFPKSYTEKNPRSTRDE